MRRLTAAAVAVILACSALLLPAMAAPIPRFDTPRALLEAIYQQFLAMEDWANYDGEAAFDPNESFSPRLVALHHAADAIVMAAGDSLGALDFSPFINAQDPGGLTYNIGNPKLKSGRATASVVVLMGGKPLYSIGYELVDGAVSGWKVDDIIMPAFDSDSTVRLSEYFANPLPTE